ncbi:heme ABC transporter ATP-binding protein [Rhodobacteraceae bacterium RKSG542]|uniref:heme ABC transporter ATP-binding protein n=1 Tax=Pseudovibrio flavus TaxID=2529854 RepID=UPI0012BC5703|nr:heme ABC transporter ATP-binding protein [Pseudovibrio flavus]MTI17120.1 heme ABC transporter ATP-binding protein [Pseudovibrio flavus]
MFSASKISLKRGGRNILHDLDFEAKAGELTVIIGPNGAGKSSLLKCLSGETTPSSGQVLLDGIPLQELRSEQLAARRGVLPQASSLSFPFTVHEVVGLGIGAGISGLHGRQRDLRIMEALETVDMARHANSSYQVLSGGEKQRVHLARVLCQVWDPVREGKPNALFLDEPTSSLDLKHQLDLLGLVKNYAKAGGCAIAILHDIDLAAVYADKVLVLSDGTSHSFGVPKDTINFSMLQEVYHLSKEMIETKWAAQNTFAMAG